MTRARLLTASIVCVLGLAACPIPDGDVPPFARECTEECPKGYFCGAAGVCLPGDPPAPATIDAFTLSADDVRPDATVTATWASSNAVSCSLAVGLAAAIPVDVAGELELTLPEPGDATVSLTCIGDGGDATQELPLHVRVVAATLAVANQADAEANAAVEEVDGNVDITGTVANTSALGLRFVHGDLKVFDLAGLGAIDLPALEEVDGDVILRAGESTQSASFGVLRTIGGQLLVGAQAFLNASSASPLNAFTAPLLEEVGGAVLLSPYEYEDANGDGLADDPTLPIDNTLQALANITLTSLKTVGGAFKVEEADALTALALPAIESIEGAVVLFGNDQLAGIDWPVTHLGGGIVFDRNSLLASVRLTSLETMGTTREPVGDAYERGYAAIIPASCTEDIWEVGDLAFLENEPDGNVCADSSDSGSVEALDLSSLRAVDGRLVITGLFIPSVSLPALEQVGGITLRRNDALASASFPVLTAVGARGLNLDNDDNLEGFGSLATIEGDFSLFPSSLPVFTSLTDIGGTFALDFVNQGELASFPALANVGTLSLDAAESGTITSLVMPSLVNVGTLDLRGAQLTGAELCALTTVGALKVLGTGLTTLDGFAAVTDVTTLDIDNHVGLATCLVDALATQAGADTNNSANNTGTAPDPCAITTSICN